MAEDPSEALRDAFVLLRVFTSSSWRGLDIDSGGMRLSISRLTAAERACAPNSARLKTYTVGKPGRALTAPHVASLLEIASVGDKIRAGEIYARIQVLDEIIDLRADEDFHVASPVIEPGEMVEFGSAIVVIE